MKPSDIYNVKQKMQHFINKCCIFMMPKKEFYIHLQSCCRRRHKEYTNPQLRFSSSAYTK